MTMCSKSISCSSSDSSDSIDFGNADEVDAAIAQLEKLFPPMDFEALREPENQQVGATHHEAVHQPQAPALQENYPAQQQESIVYAQEPLQHDDVLNFFGINFDDLPTVTLSAQVDASTQTNDYPITVETSTQANITNV